MTVLIDYAYIQCLCSSGVHIFQETYGCEWDDETGTTNGFRQYGYDGEDFLDLDLKELRYISPVQEGIRTVWSWNNDRAVLESNKQYFSTMCIEWLQKYLQYGKSSLEKTGTSVKQSSTLEITVKMYSFFLSELVVFKAIQIMCFVCRN